MDLSFKGEDPSPPLSGLCASCVWCRRVPNRRGSVFVLCRLAEEDARYPRYPRLPVLDCAGYESD